MKSAELKKIVKDDICKTIDKAFIDLDELETVYGYTEVSPKLISKIKETAEYLMEAIGEEIYETIRHGIYE